VEQPAGLRWPDREFPVTTGLGFYSIVSLAVTVLHSQQIVGPWHLRLDWLGILGY